MIPTKAFWAEFKPINPATGLTVRVRICTLNTADATGIDLGNGEWLPYMSSFPDTEISVFDGQFDGVGESTLDSVQADDINQFALMFPSYIWDGTDVTVYKGSESTTTLGGLTKIFSGSVTETPSNEDDTVKWSIRDKSYLFDTEILKTTYAGTSGYEGTAEMKGVSKPFTLGEALNLEPILVDPAYLIYQYHGYGSTIGVQGLYENGLGFGAGQTAVAWAGSTAATFAALRAKVLTAGQWCDCPSIGMFRLGGEPVSGGVISCDVKGHAVGGVLIEKIDEAMNLLISQAPAAVGALVDGSSYTGLYSGSANQTVADYFTGPVNLGEILSKYLADCGAYHFINTAGLLRFGFVRMGTPALEIRTDGTAYPVPEDATVQPVSAPYKRIRMGADRVFRVHSLDEISDALYQAVSQLQTELTTLTNDYYLALNDDNLTIQEKIQTAIPTNTYYTNQYSELRPRAVSLGLSVTALDAAYNAYITDRNLISPAWNNTSLNSTGIPATFRANVAALGAALVAISVDISEEDAKRADWRSVDSRPAIGELYYDFNYVDLADMIAAGWIGLSSTYDSVSATSDSPGGKALLMGNGSVAERSFVGPEWVPYNSTDLYEIAFDVEVVSAAASTFLYLGVQAVDKNGNNLGASNNYVAMSEGNQTALVGTRFTQKGYFSGFTSSSTSGQSNDPLSPAPLPDGVYAGFGQGGAVKFRPVVISNYQNKSGQIKVHAIRIIRIPARLAAKDEVTFGSPLIKEVTGGAQATLANFKTALGQAASIYAQGALATKSNVDMSTSDVAPRGSIPPMLPDNGFTYTSGLTTITISWPTMTIYRPDGTTISISSGSQAVTGLSSGTSYRVYPYVVDNGTGSGNVSFVTSGGSPSYGSPAIMYGNTGNVTAASLSYLIGRIPMGAFNCNTTTGGSGGGGGGGWNCLHENMPVGDKPAAFLEVGECILTPSGFAEILKIEHHTCSKWYEIYSGNYLIGKFTERHLLYLAKGDKEVKAMDVHVGDILKGRDRHYEVTELRLCRDSATAVGIQIDDPHLLYAGEVDILCHNGTQKP